MSNKNLLNESTIRKFMKLANMEPLAEEFVSTHLQTEDEEVELEEGTEEEETLEETTDETIEETTDETIDEMGGYMGKDDDEPMDDLGGEEPMDDEPMDDLGGEEEMGGDAEVSLDEEEVAALKAALEAAQSVMDKLAGGLGDEEPMDDLAGEEEPMDDLGEPEMDDPAGRDVDMMEEEELEEEDLGIDLVDENELVAEVLKKVVNRLAKKG
jgi:hypothetical protein